MFAKLEESPGKTDTDNFNMIELVNTHFSGIMSSQRNLLIASSKMVRDLESVGCYRGVSVPFSYPRFLFSVMLQSYMLDTRFLHINREPTECHTWEDDFELDLCEEPRQDFFFHEYQYAILTAELVYSPHDAPSDDGVVVKGQWEWYGVGHRIKLEELERGWQKSVKHVLQRYDKQKQNGRL